MKDIVYTLWTKPLLNNNLYNNVTYLLLSIHLAKQFANNICIYTDNYGEKILKNFNLDVEIKIDIINKLSNLDIKRWSIPKLYTIQDQDKPFCHIDHDVFLWEEPKFEKDYQMVLQNKECGNFFYRLYKKSFDNYINNNTTILYDLINYNNSNDFCGFNCGYIDVYDINISKKWSKFALNLNDTFAHNFEWDDCVLVEQFSLYFLYKKYQLNFGELFQIENNYSNFKYLKPLKYTHLMRSKKFEFITEKVEKNIQKLNPDLYNKLLENKNFF